MVSSVLLRQFASKPGNRTHKYFALVQGGILRASYSETGRSFQITAEVNLLGVIEMSIVSGTGAGGRLAITLTDYDMVGRTSANVRVARGGGSSVSAVLNVVQAGGVRFAGNIDVVSNNLPGACGACLYRF